MESQTLEIFSKLIDDLYLKKKSRPVVDHRLNSVHYSKQIWMKFKIMAPNAFAQNLQILNRCAKSIGTIIPFNLYTSKTKSDIKILKIIILALYIMMLYIRFPFSLSKLQFFYFCPFTSSKKSLFYTFTIPNGFF